MKKNASVAKTTLPDPQKVAAIAKELGVSLDYAFRLCMAGAGTAVAPAPAPTERRIRTHSNSDYGRNGGEEPDWTTVERKCAHCGETKFVMPNATGFGIRAGVNGRKYAFAWCSDCRKEKAKESAVRIRRER